MFVHTIGDAAAAAGLAAGWHAGLEVVEAQLAGREITWSPWDRGEELAPAYADLAVVP